MSTDTAPQLISAEELAGLLGISERTLWRLLSARQLPQPLRLGRNTRWRSDEIRRWIEAGCQPPHGK
ncbi:helix-turn-helix transcriptional regulator [Planctomyces sp. SH-PL62]|uniref:helix-turn-helix transcriptional regulator n=1 Tax=Planctomyces sp. SH-PL62 TaxID=1636152 RepID=UPI00078E0851|nr:helix-turn-helix domain-containing protein [Planctomyces sp. SH-PL62]AMV40262.1 Prophage CP4-57 regulatory protein (AlpA) [Planctomyces sp. SH-PL62]